MDCLNIKPQTMVEIEENSYKITTKIEAWVASVIKIYQCYSNKTVVLTEHSSDYSNGRALSKQLSYTKITLQSQGTQ